MSPNFKHQQFMDFSPRNDINSTLTFQFLPSLANKLKHLLQNFCEIWSFIASQSNIILTFFTIFGILNENNFTYYGILVDLGSRRKKSPTYKNQDKKRELLLHIRIFFLIYPLILTFILKFKWKLRSMPMTSSRKRS